LRTGKYLYNIWGVVHNFGDCFKSNGPKDGECYMELSEESSIGVQV